MAARKGLIMNRWRVVIGGMSMNLALGSLYAWSVFVLPLEREFSWTRAQTSWVFTLAIVTFALTFVLAGRMQDKFGPRLCAFAGALLVSLGFFLASMTMSLLFLYIVFGVIVGAGNGFGFGRRVRCKLGDYRSAGDDMDHINRLAVYISVAGRRILCSWNAGHVAYDQSANRLPAGRMGTQKDGRQCLARLYSC